VKVSRGRRPLGDLYETKLTSWTMALDSEVISFTHSSRSKRCVGIVRFGMQNVYSVHFIPEAIHVLATRLAAYVSSDSTTAKVTI
jgi:hypothetical protein